MIRLPDPTTLLAGAVLLLLASGGAYVWGRNDGQAIANADHFASSLKASEDARAVEAGAAAINLDIGAKHSEKLTEFLIVRKIIEREVTANVTPEADRNCAVPAGFVQLHDNAAAGRVPDLSGSAGDVDAPTTVALSTVAKTVTGNYGTCNEIRTQLIDFQEWARRQRKNATAPDP